MFDFERNWVGIALLAALGAGGCGDGARAGGSVEFTERSREAPNGGDAAHLDWLRANYDKSEHMVPMRDGAELYTIVYTPRFAADPVPVMLFRTPYSIAPYEPGEYRNPLGPSAEFDRAGYVFVFQDVRGKFRSEGDFEVIRPLAQKPKGPATVDESTDNYDAIEWALANVEGHNGRVGQWGISYPGWQTVMGMVDAHPALAASSPQASPSDMFIGDDWHHNGAFRVMYAFSWLARNARRRDAPTDVRPGGFDYGTNSGYDFFLEAGSASNIDALYFHGDVPAWNDFIEHDTYDDYWQRQNALPHLRNIEHPILNVAGWFDTEDFYGPMSIYRTIEAKNPGTENTLAAGPWLHGGWSRMLGDHLGCIEFGDETSVTFQRDVQLPFFEHHLRGAGEVIDVYPDDAPDSPFCDVPMGGYQMHLAGEIMRGRFRKSLENPEPMVPGEVTPIHIDLRDRYHTFKAGHRIMVHVQSSWFPAYDRNTQQFVDTYRATPGQYVAAEQTVYRGADRPSRVTFGVVR